MEKLSRIVIEMPGKTYTMEAGSGQTDIITPTEGGSNNDGEINTVQEVINVLKGLPEDKTIAEILEEQECDLTDEDVENFFYDPEYSNITADVSGENVILTIDGRYIDGEDVAEWELTLDGVKHNLTGEGKSITLSEEDTAAFNQASTAQACVTIDDCRSDVYTLK